MPERTGIKKEYEIKKDEDTLVIISRNYAPGRGSILHPGIYGRELASSLAAGAIVLLLALVAGIGFSFLNMAVFILIFGAVFIIFMLFVFRGDALATTVDRASGRILIDEKRFLGGEKSYGFRDLISSATEHIVINPENPDAVRVIEKIALQHGTVIPGFGETLDFYAVTLGFKDGGKTVIHRTKERSEADEIVSLVLEYTGRNNA